MTAGRLSPVERCLGPAAAAGGPFELLGLPIEPVDPRTVQEALRRRLARLAASPLAATPEAEEVRLALHAAAAQLSDPLVRDHLLELWRHRGQAPLQRNSGEVEDDSRTASLRLLALRVLARSGGWNRRSRRRVAALAHALGAPPAALAAALRRPRETRRFPASGAAGLSEPPAARVERARSGPASTAPIERALQRGARSGARAALRCAQGGGGGVDDEQPGRAGWVVALAAALALGALAATSAWLLAMRTSGAKAPIATLPKPAQADAVAKRPAPAGRVREEPAAPRTAAQEQQRPLLDRARMAVQRAVEGAAAPSNRAERFDAALAALTQAAPSLPLDDPQRWAPWLGLVDQLGEAFSGEAERAKLATLTLDALESAVKRAEQGLSVEVVQGLLERAPLGDGAPPALRSAARSRVLDWFDDRTAPAAGVAALTRALAQRSDLGLVRPDMTLAPHAGFAPRLAMRDRYAKAFGLAAQRAGRELPRRWVEAVGRILDQNVGGADVETLARAAALLRFSLAAALRERGETSAAAQLMASFDSEDAARGAGAGVWVTFRGASAEDGAWGAQIHAARNNAEKKIKALFDLAARTQPIGPVDADILALLAVADPNQEVRLRAQGVLRQRRSEVAVVNGLLEALPMAHPTLSTAALVEAVALTSLPPPGADPWKAAAQRALARRLLTLLEGSSAHRGAAAIERDLAATLQRLAEIQGAAAAGPLRAAEAAEQAARRTVAQARLLGAALRGEEFSPEAIERRLDAQLGRARSPAQRTAAALTALAEAQAARLAAASPSRAPLLRLALVAQTALLDRARSSLEQIELAARTIAALWLLQGGDASGVEGLWRRVGATRPSDAGEAPEPSLDGMALFEEAERIALTAATQEERRLARRLYAASLLREHPPSLRSVALALRELATSDRERRTLEALAQASRSLLEPRVADWRQGPDAVERNSGDVDRERAAWALLLYQGGLNAQAAALLQEPAVRTQVERALTEAGSLTPLQAMLAAVAAPACSLCRGERFVPDGASEAGYRLCPSCQGDPGPQLDGAELAALLRAQLLLLGEPAAHIIDTLSDRRPLAPLAPALLQLRYNPGRLERLAEEAGLEGASGGA